jgi:hypothetical protein
VSELEQALRERGFKQTDLNRWKKELGGGYAAALERLGILAEALDAVVRSEKPSASAAERTQEVNKLRCCGTRCNWPRSRGWFPFCESWRT